MRSSVGILHSDQREYDEQTLAIPLPTNKADPETAILTTFFYMKMNQERAIAFRGSTESPVSITARLLREWPNSQATTTAYLGLNRESPRGSTTTLPV